MSSPASRRGFLRDLVGLPLIGGGLTIIGTPSAVAAPITHELLDSYDAWLFYERWRLLRERNGPRCVPPDFAPMRLLDGRSCDHIPLHNAGFRWQCSLPHDAPASPRAALVLAAVGCGWESRT